MKLYKVEGERREGIFIGEDAKEVYCLARIMYSDNQLRVKLLASADEIHVCNGSGIHTLSHIPQLLMATSLSDYAVVTIVDIYEWVDEPIMFTALVNGQLCMVVALDEPYYLAVEICEQDIERMAYCQLSLRNIFDSKTRKRMRLQADDGIFDCSIVTVSEYYGQDLYDLDRRLYFHYTCHLMEGK